MLKVTHDEASDSVYVHLIDQPISHSVELTEDMLVDVASDGTVVGIDIHNWTAVMQERDVVQRSPGHTLQVRP